MAQQVTFDPRDLRSLDDLQHALKQSIDYQASLDKRIDQSLKNWPAVAADQDRLVHLGPTIDVLQTDVQRAADAIEFALTLADSVSSKVRQLDLAKSRVFSSIQRVDDILDLNYCTEGVRETLEQKNYEQAARHIHRYLCLDEHVLRNTKIESSDQIAKSLEVLKKARDELKDIIYQKFDAAVKKNNGEEVERYFKLFPLLKLHTEGLEKFSAYISGQVELEVGGRLEDIYALAIDHPRAPYRYADALSKLLECVAFHVEAKQALVETYCGPGKVYSLLKCLQDKCDELAGDVLKRFRQYRRVDAHSRQVRTLLRGDMDPVVSILATTEQNKKAPGIAPEDVNDLLIEMALMAKQYESYIGFIRRRALNDIEVAFPKQQIDTTSYSNEPSEAEQLEEARTLLLGELDHWTSRCKLSEQMQHIMSDFVQFEEFTIRKRVVNLLKTDRLDPGVLSDLTDRSSMMMSLEEQTDPIPLTNLCIDDIFYVLKLSIQRTVRTKCVHSTCAIINVCEGMLSPKLVGHIQKTIDSGYPTPAENLSDTLGINDLMTTSFTGSQTARSKTPDKYGATVSATEKWKMEYLAACNNTEKAIDNVQSLVKQLKEQVHINFMNVEPQKLEILQNCVKMLLATADEFERMQSNAMHDLISKIKLLIKPKIMNFTRTERTLNEEQFYDYQANDPWVNDLLANLSDLLLDMKRVLSITLYNRLVGMLTTVIAALLEDTIKRPKYNLFGALQLQQETRKIIAFLTNASEKSVRHEFARLQQTVQILNFETPSDLTIYYGDTADNTTWRMTKSEMKAVMTRRNDFERGAIERVFQETEQLDWDF